MRGKFGHIILPNENLHEMVNFTIMTGFKVTRLKRI